MVSTSDRPYTEAIRLEPRRAGYHANRAAVGPARYCSPRHQVPCNSRIEGCNRLYDVAGNGPGRYSSVRHGNPFK